MKPTLEEIETIINHIAEALTYAKEARRVAKKVYGSQTEINTDLKHAYDKLHDASDILNNI